jgi:predicted kinase
MPKCTILVGVPASGKSTWLVNNLDINNMPLSAWVVSTDMIIERLADDYGFTYNEIFSETIRFADMVMVKRMIFAAEKGYDLYIDRTNMSEKSRRQFINKLKKYEYEFECVVFPTPEPEEWKRRLDSRPGKTIPQEALDRMQNSYEIPLESEGFSKITFIDNGE